MMLIFCSFFIQNWVSLCQERELALELFKNYSKIQRPVRDGTKPIEIFIGGFKLFEVEHINELTSTLTIKGWLVVVKKRLIFCLNFNFFFKEMEGCQFGLGKQSGI